MADSEHNFNFDSDAIEAFKKLTDALNNFTVKNLDEPVRKTRRTTTSKSDIYEEANAAFKSASPERQPLGLRPAGWKSQSTKDYESRIGLRPGSGIDIRPAGPRPRKPEGDWGPRNGPEVSIPRIWDDKPKAPGFIPEGWKYKPQTNFIPGERYIPPGEKGHVSTEKDDEKTYKRDSIRYFKEFGKYTKDFKIVSSAIASGNILGTAGGLAKLMGPVGGAASVGIGAAGFSIDRANDFREQQQAAQALGTQPFQKAAFTNFMKKYAGAGGATTALSEVLRQTTQVGGKELFGGFLGEQGIRTTGKETAEENAENLMRAYQNMAKNVPESLWGITATKYGITPDINAIKTMQTKGTTREQLEASISEERKASALEQAPEDAKTLEDAAEKFDAAVNSFTSDLTWLSAKILKPWTSSQEATPIPWGNLLNTPFNQGMAPHKDEKGQSEYLDQQKGMFNDLKEFFSFSQAHAGDIDLNKKLNAGGDKSTFGDLPIPSGLGKNPANMPSVDAGVKAFEVGGKDFMIPGEEKMPQNIQDIRDALVGENWAKERYGPTAGLTDDQAQGIMNAPGFGSAFGGTGGGGGSAGEGGGDGGGVGGGGSRPHSRSSSSGGGNVGGGSSAGVGGAAPKMTQSSKKVAAMIADKFKKAGASEEGIAGMMPNISDESGFNAANRHFDQPRFKGTEAENAHGLWQMGGTEWNNYAKWINKNHPGANWADPSMQTDYQIENLQKNYPNLWKEMKSHTPAAQQAGDFVGGYEHPAAAQLAARRAKYARGVPDIKKYTGGESPDNDSGVTAGSQTDKASGIAGAATSVGAEKDPSGNDPKAFIMHHTAGRGGPESVVAEWKEGKRFKGGGAQYIMDRNGVVHDTLKEYGWGGTNEILPGKGVGAGLNNKNVVGMEIVAKNDADVTPEQVKSATEFMRKNYPNTPVFGHGQVNPGHREETEGQSARLAVEADRARIAKADATSKKMASMPEHPHSSTGGSGAPTPHIGDMSMFQQQPQFNLNVRNEAGANINRNVAMMGSSSGSFNA